MPEPATDGVQLTPHVTLYSDRIEVSLSFFGSEVSNPERRADLREEFCKAIAQITQSAYYTARTSDSAADWKAGRS